MESFAKVAGDVVGSFMAAFIITWVVGRPVRWIAVTIAPKKREMAALCAFATMVLVTAITWRADLIWDISMCVSVAINFLLHWAWAKYPQETKKPVISPPNPPTQP